MEVGRFRVVPASYVIFLRGNGDDTEVLLQLRSGTGYLDGYWALAAAGHIEQGESAFEAAKREATEELGVHGLQLTALTAMHRTGGTGTPIDERVDYFFIATSWHGEPQIIEPNKCADLRWFRLDALPDPVAPHELSVLELMIGGTVPPIITYGFADHQAVTPAGDPCRGLPAPVASTSDPRRSAG
ncbi:MAG: NUDIX domain-containing protein [Actinomycetota bacterium]|nr:NUDIX domain-containing protein [Actinomycetota bacterium]